MKGLPARSVTTSVLATLLLFAGASPHAEAAAMLQLAFSGPCNITAGGPKGLPASNINKGVNRSFTCWAGSTLTGAKNVYPTFFEAIQADSVFKVNSTYPGTTKNKTLRCLRPDPTTTVGCTGGITFTGTMAPLVDGPWCGHWIGTFSASITSMNTSISGGWFLTGSTLVLLGVVTHGLQSGHFTGTASITPNPFALATCSGPGTTSFYMAGTGTGEKTGPGTPPFDSK